MFEKVRLTLLSTETTYLVYLESYYLTSCLLSRLSSKIGVWSHVDILTEVWRLNSMICKQRIFQFWQQKSTFFQEYSIWLYEELGMEKNSRELHIVTPLHLRKFEVLSRQERCKSSADCIVNMWLSDYFSALFAVILLWPNLFRDFVAMMRFVKWISFHEFNSFLWNFIKLSCEFKHPCDIFPISAYF